MTKLVRGGCGGLGKTAGQRLPCVEADGLALDSL